ncbi:hypothetical protein Celaphus_00018495 [Cervus elaphus hippelaphus]|uniref:Cullin family profile domain-containing protein n=1 Tax=Cervus elaphus hippelaphus TaxID=46360 RepID=A0A212CLZ1_CEREH|nr:hypothetical protein Celaphus_00018495 [Cervus elaphus hippelaphus]
MFQDTGVSKDLNEQFKLRATGLGFQYARTEFRIAALSGALYFCLAFVAGRELPAIHSLLRVRCHSGRKSTWLYQLSKGELVTNYFKNRYTLQTSTVQMAIRPQYNTEDAYAISS